VYHTLYYALYDMSVRVKAAGRDADIPAVKRLLPWLLPAALAAGLAPRPDGDSWLFVQAGHVLLSSDWSHTFADKAVQVGPLQLALYASLGGAVGYVVAAAVALLVVSAARAVGVAQPQVLALAGLVAIPLGLTSSGVDAGHPANAVLPLLWVIAAAQARRGRVAAGALVVGLSAGLETWGLLGIAVLALAPRRRSALLGGALAAAVAASLFLPFVLFGDFAMGSYRWRVSHEALMSIFVAAGTPIGWPLRFVQGAVALGAGVWLARRTRLSWHVLWAVPAVIVLVRLLLDPLGSGYYYVGLEAPALAGLALVVAYGLRLPRLAREPLS
jgi:hypothetical protein